MGFTIIYLIIGFLFLILLEGLGKHLKSDHPFNNKERLAVSMLWPLGVVLFIGSFIISFLNSLK